MWCKFFDRFDRLNATGNKHITASRRYGFTRVENAVVIDLVQSDGPMGAMFELFFVSLTFCLSFDQFSLQFSLKILFRSTFVRAPSISIQMQ